MESSALFIEKRKGITIFPGINPSKEQKSSLNRSKRREYIEWKQEKYTPVVIQSKKITINL